MFNVVVIGEVQSIREGGYRACWRVNLPGMPPLWRYALTTEAARLRLTDKAMEWIDAAGLAPALPIDGVIRTTTVKGANNDGRQNGECDRRRGGERR